MNVKREYRKKIAAAVKFFFTGEDASYTGSPSPAMALSNDQLDLVTGGDPAAAKAYLLELCKKYGVKNKYDALALATEEELIHHLKLFST